MKYRVHYCVEDERRTAEVEAGSPHEAAVKFRHTRRQGEDRRGRPPRILSISHEPKGDELLWW